MRILEKYLSQRDVTFGTSDLERISFLRSSVTFTRKKKNKKCVDLFIKYLFKLISVLCH